jgi:hypothetical protein
MSQDLRVLQKIEGFLAEFSKGLRVPEQKFLRDLVFGILRSQSALLSKIARAISEPADVISVYKRLDINLGTYDLSRAYGRAQSAMLKRVDESFLFIFDPSEVVKPFGKKMEGLSLVRDASEKPKRVKSAVGKYVEVPVLKPGYPLCVAIAMSPAGDILPVELTLYSFASEFFVSANDENIQAMETLIHKTHFLPTLVLDREFDSFSIIRHLCDLRQRFVIRVTKNRKYRIAGAALVPNAPTFTREEIVENSSFLTSSAWITYSKKGKTQTYLFEFKAAHVELLSEQKKSGVVRDVGDEQALTLVQVKIKKERGTPVLYLLTNARPNTPDELTWIARSYLARWNIEEYIRFLKQHFALESFLVRDLGRMKNLVMATYIATVIIHLLTDRRTNFGFKTHEHLLEYSLPVTAPRKSRDFFLYSYGMGLANIVSLNKKLLSPPQAIPIKSENDAQLNFRV